MILYFANRHIDILGHASTSLPEGFTISDDKKAEDIETGVATFSCYIGFKKDSQLKCEELTEVGNYLLRSDGNEKEFYTIIDAEIDTKNQEIYIYAEDAGLDLINEVVGDFEATIEQPAEWYINQFAADSGFEIGINETEGLTRRLVWNSEQTVTERLADIANEFGGCELSYSFEIEGMKITHKYINIYKQRGKDNPEQLRLNREIDRIRTSKTISNLATALEVTGGTPDDADSPITLKGFSYDDGDFFVDGTKLKSRNAVEKWSRYISEGKSSEYAGHIVKPFSSEATTQAEVCAEAVAYLKEICDIEINFEIDITRLPDNVAIGDRINIVDDAGELYVSTRILKLEKSVANNSHVATLGEHLIKTSGISQKVKDLAAQFAKQTISVQRAKVIANNAKEIAEAAQAQAETAAGEAAAAVAKADEAKGAADTATQSANNAQAEAKAAQAAVDKVEESVTALETTVTNAKAAADNAQAAAETATAKAEEAETAATNALARAEAAETAAGNAQTAAESATTKANEAIGTADKAKTTAEEASATAAAAKLDAEQAEKDIATFAENLETVENTMKADYARKTELTEATASLQTQITQNAGQISLNASKVQEIDETANNAADLAESAQNTAVQAQQQANQATADATAAQTAADNAAAAATAAQNEADTAKAAAATAQGVADKAKTDLEAAKADLETVQGRVDATEAEIAAAEAAVKTAQDAADKAQADADTAAQTAADAQASANTAVSNAEAAQNTANEAAATANAAQQVANEAKGNAETAQARADEAAQIAANAQATANTAKSNAESAQNKANEAAAQAATAQQAADDADAKAAQAAADLETAQQNLASVTSRVDATEEEVAAAQAAVVTAQAAADKAKQDAAAAQSTADTAKANATAAQTAADNAKTAADNAQKAADDAQAAADQAQADVEKLKTRMTNAETSISNNAEAISLRATKTEVDFAIDSVVIGARNLAERTQSQWQNSEVYQWSGGIDYSIKGTERHGKLVSFEEIGLSVGDDFTISIDLNAINKAIKLRVDLYRGSTLGENYNSYSTEAVEIGTSKRVVYTKTVTEEFPYFAIYIGNHDTTNATVTTEQYKCLKIEKGNKATDWTPAPEDIAEDIGTAQNAADLGIDRIAAFEAELKILADSINSFVRNGETDTGSYVKQTADGLYYFDISEIENNLSSIANSLDTLDGLVLDAEGKIDIINSTVEALRARTEYIKSYTNENDQPCLELGEGDSFFKVYITNTEIKFADGTSVPAYISNKKLMIENAVVKEELQFGDDAAEDISGVWVWKRRKNGNLGLMWKGGAE